jgi:hypothetical protein
MPTYDDWKTRAPEDDSVEEEIPYRHWDFPLGNELLTEVDSARVALRAKVANHLTADEYASGVGDGPFLAPWENDNE